MQLQPTIKEKGVIVIFDRNFGQICECPRCGFAANTWRWLSKDESGKELIQCPNCKTEF